MAENEATNGTGNGAGAANGAGNGAAENGQDLTPSASVLAQYVKDLSFENPNAPVVYQWQGQPQVDVQFNIGSKKVADEIYEVALKIEATAKADEGVAFAVELVYAGLFAIRNVEEGSIEVFLLTEAPRLLFPFARRIVADATRDGNFPPLMLEPIDFAALYQAQLAGAGQLGEQGAIGQA